MNAQGPSPVEAAPISGLAIGSLVAGCMVLLPVLAGVMAVVLGAVAHRRIAEADGAIRGAGLATAGMVLGAIQVVGSIGLLAWWSAVHVGPGAQGLVARDARIDRVLPEGLHFIVPLVERAVVLETERVHETAPDVRRYLRVDKSQVSLSTVISWRVCDAPRYYTSLRAEPRRASARIVEVVRSRLRNRVARLPADDALDDGSLARLGDALVVDLAPFVDDLGVCVVRAGITVAPS